QCACDFAPRNPVSEADPVPVDRTTYPTIPYLYRMKSTSLLCFALSVLVFAGCADKENDHRKWYKGNLHTHSYWSDGDEFPEMIMDWYKGRDYDFVALTDHNILAQGEKWVVVRKGRIYEDAFEKYLAKF